MSPQHPHSNRDRCRNNDPESLPPGDLTGFLDDPPCRTILRETSTRPLPARTLVDACDASRPTVYRRLNALQEAGLVESTMQYHPDGYHRQAYRAAVEEVRISLGNDGLTADVVTAEATGDTGAAD